MEGQPGYRVGTLIVTGLMRVVEPEHYLGAGGQRVETPEESIVFVGPSYVTEAYVADVASQREWCMPMDRWTDVVLRSHRDGQSEQEFVEAVLSLLGELFEFEIKETP